MIQVTSAAAAALLDLVRDKATGNGLRLAIEKGGCAGLQYAMTIGVEGPGDIVVAKDGAQFFVDPESASYLDECTLDYDDGLSGAGFRIINPKAVRSCGCGTSFEPGAAVAP